MFCTQSHTREQQDSRLLQEVGNLNFDFQNQKGQRYEFCDILPTRSRSTVTVWAQERLFIEDID